MICPNPECPDVQRTGNPGRYRQGFTHCAKCDAALVPEAEQGPGAASSPGMPGADFEDFLPVMPINNSTLIPVVRSILDEAGIRYFIKNERAHDMVGYMRLTSGGYNSMWQPLVLVEPSRAEEARALLRDPLEEVNDGDGQTSFRSIRRPSKLIVIGMWVAFGPAVPLYALVAFSEGWTLEALPGAVAVVIVSVVLWRVTASYLRSGGSDDET